MARYRCLKIFKRDADCYDIVDDRGRVAGLRSDFTEDSPGGARTATPGTWRISHIKDRDGVQFTGMKFASATEAFAAFCGQCLE